MNNIIKRIANKINQYISHIDDIKILQLNIGDTVYMTEDFFLSTQRQGKPILYYNGNFLQSNETNANTRIVHRHLMERYFKDINLHKNDIIKKQSIQEWQKVDEFSRIFDFEQIGLLLHNDFIIVLYYSNNFSINQVINIIKSQFNTLIFYSQPDKGRLTRIAYKLNNNKNNILIVLNK